MKSKIITRPTKRKGLSHDDFYAEISDAWERRAKELQARRWAKIKHLEREGLYYDKHAFI